MEKQVNYVLLAAFKKKKKPLCQHHKEATVFDRLR